MGVHVPGDLSGNPATASGGEIRPRPPGPRPPLNLEEEVFLGRIKRYVDMPNGGGYGFIDCEETKLHFSRDVYIHKNQMNGLQPGDQVAFTISRNQRGEPQARNVMRGEDAPLLRAQSAAKGLPAAAL